MPSKQNSWFFPSFKNDEGNSKWGALLTWHKLRYTFELCPKIPVCGFFRLSTRRMHQVFRWNILEKNITVWLFMNSEINFITIDTKSLNGLVDWISHTTLTVEFLFSMICCVATSFHRGFFVLFCFYLLGSVTSTFSIILIFVWRLCPLLYIIHNWMNNFSQLAICNI